MVVAEVDAAAEVAVAADDLRWEPLAAVAVDPQEETPAQRRRRPAAARPNVNRPSMANTRGPILVRGQTLLRGQRGVEISVPPAARGRTSIGQTQILAGRAWRRGRRSLLRTMLDQSTGLRYQAVDGKCQSPQSRRRSRVATARIWEATKSGEPT